MAASLLVPKLNFKPVINSRNFSLGKPLNLARYNKSKFYYVGPLRQEGDFVTNGTNIYSHSFTQTYAPGLNILATGRGQMIAKVSGTVVISTEKTNFDFDKKYVLRIPNAEGVKYMDYINVIPQPQHNRFKLLDTI